MKKQLLYINSLEAEKILGRRLKTYEDIPTAAKELLTYGFKSILFRVEHFEDKLDQDYWTNGLDAFWLSNKFFFKTICERERIFDSVIKTCQAEGYSLIDALVIAKMYENQKIRKPKSNDWPEDQKDLPYLSFHPLREEPEPFKTCKLGLYPIVDRSHWLEKLLPLGVKTIQLRIKDLHGEQLATEIKRSVALAKKYSAILFVNDYWDLAIRFGADGVHLGQEDLNEADIYKIRESGLYLGISTHCYYEVARAHSYNPSYIACGPIYSTTSKIMSFNPQGLEQLFRWRRTLKYPLVAIGGINLERLPHILQTGVEGVALISAITKAKNPALVTKKFLKILREQANG